VNQHLTSVVREIRTLRSVGAGGGRLSPATRWAHSNVCPYRDLYLLSAFWELPSMRSLLFLLLGGTAASASEAKRVTVAQLEQEVNACRESRILKRQRGSRICN